MAYYDWKKLINACIAGGGRPAKKDKDLDFLAKSLAWLESSGAPCPGPSQRTWIMEIATALCLEEAAFEIAAPPKEGGGQRQERRESAPQQSAPPAGPQEFQAGPFHFEKLDGATDWDIRIGNQLFARAQMMMDQARAAGRILEDAIRRGWAFTDKDGRTAGNTPPPAPRPTPVVPADDPFEEKPAPTQGAPDDDNLPF